MCRVDSLLPTSSSELTKTMGVTVGLKAEILQRSEGEDHLHKSALHVVDAGTLDNVVLDLDRHHPKRPERPDGVAVSEQELHWGVVCAGAGPRVEVSTAPASGHTPRRVSDLDKGFGEDV